MKIVIAILVAIDQNSQAVYYLLITMPSLGLAMPNMSNKTYKVSKTYNTTMMLLKITI